MGGRAGKPPIEWSWLEAAQSVEICGVCIGMSLGLFLGNLAWYSS